MNREYTFKYGLFYIVACAKVDNGEVVKVIQIDIFADAEATLLLGEDLSIESFTKDQQAELLQLIDNAEWQRYDREQNKIKHDRAVAFADYMLDRERETGAM